MSGFVGKSWSAIYPATSSSVQVAIGLTFTMSLVSSHETIGASTRVEASTRFKPVIHAALPLRARASGTTLRNSQHRAEPHGQSAASGPGLSTLRFRL